MKRPGAIFDFEGSDPLDAQVSPAPTLVLSPLDVLLRRRAAIGLSAVTPPAVLFVPLGYLLGPQGAGVLSATALAYLDTVVVVALASLGCLVGMALEFRDRDDWRMLAAAVLEASITVVVVGGAGWWLVRRWELPLDIAPLIVAVALGLAASASSAGGPEVMDHPGHAAAGRIAMLDDVVPIVGIGVLVGTIGTTGGSTGQLFGLTLTIGLSLAVAGWLLFESSGDTAERGVFVIGVLVAIGGSAVYLRISPLLAGVTAGLFWTLAPGAADDIVRGHVRRIQHPLVVMLLIVAGARMVLDSLALWLLVVFVVFRLSGKVLGGWLAARVVPRVAPADLGAYLLSPGLMGIASALILAQSLATPTGTALLTAVAAGAVLSEVVAMMVLPGGTRR